MKARPERSLTENLLAFAGLIERQRHLGMTATPEGVAVMLRSLEVMTAQAQRAENSIAELTRELVEENALPIGQVRPIEGAGSPAQRIEWAAIETAQCAGRIARSEVPERFELAAWLRTIASQNLATAEMLHKGEIQACRGAGRVPGWIRGIIEGGRA